MLGACGGGGDSQPAPQPSPPGPANQVPTITSQVSATVQENTSGAIYQATASDPEGSPVSFSISGTDAAQFAITASGTLSFVRPPNFDLPNDSSSDNIYQVQLNASDGQGTGSLALTIQVTNSKEGIAVRRVASGFSSPVAMSPVNDSLILVAEKAGAIYGLDPQTGTRSLLVQIGYIGSAGVWAIAAAPDFATTGTFFVMYSNGGGFVVVERYLRNPAGPTVPDAFGPILGLGAPTYAGGGWLGYGADGNLLIATGDAGGDGDPTGSAQNPASFFGKLIRATPNPDPFAGASAVFFLFNKVGSGLHRPSNGVPLNGGLLLPDSGQAVSEEVNVFPTGGTVNFGWPFKEGTRQVRGAAPAGAVDPVIEYPRSMGLRIGQGVVGGAIGPASLPSIANHYVFADRGGAILSIPLSNLSANQTLPLSAIEKRDQDFAPDVGAIDSPVAIIRGSVGAIYILDSDGEVFRVDAG